MSDMKLKVDEAKFYYPDVMVACDRAPRDRFYREVPTLIVEVASPSTRETDRREKPQAYQQMPSVVEYLLVEQDEMRAELHRRQPSGGWVTYLYTGAESSLPIVFESVGSFITLDGIYDRVDLG